MHSSFSPLTGGMALLNILLGEVIFGGVGAGLYGMLIFVILTVFIAGLMVGRTPEYLGKKIEAFEIKMAMIAVLLPSACILLFSALAVVTTAGLSSRANAGPHGLSEILYAFASGAGNNGSAFCRPQRQHTLLQHADGLCHVDWPLWRYHSGAGHWRQHGGQESEPAFAGRFSHRWPALCGAAQRRHPDCRRTHFLPGAQPGSSVEQLLMQAGHTF
ncbi:MAG: potassium-transporting ATPase subunit KdpA [Caldilineaceae bacterium]